MDDLDRAPVPWCPDHDPLIRAGHIACRHCGRRAYPVAADWFGSLIIASYAPGSGCGHFEDGPALTWLVDPDATQRDSRWCGELTRSTGEPCRNRGRPEHGGRCHLHARRGVA